MSPKDKILRPGLRPNEFIRKLFFGFLIGKTAFGVALLFLYAALEVKVGLYVAPIFLASVPGYVWGLMRYKVALVLDDGLELDGRFVPFSEVTAVETPTTQSIRIAYRFHGVELCSDLAFSPMQSINVMLLAQELRTAAGIMDVPVTAGGSAT